MSKDQVRAIKTHIRELLGDQLVQPEVKIVKETRSGVIVNLANQALTSIPADLFKDHSHIHKIFLQNNQLEVLPSGVLYDLKNLEGINLSSNKLQLIEPDIFTGNPLLSFINLRNNELDKLPVGLFLNNAYLELLYLDHNQISQLSHNFLANSPDLRTLTISNNPLKSLPDSVLDLYNLEELDIRETKLSHTPLKWNSYSEVQIYLNEHRRETGKEIKSDLIRDRYGKIGSYIGRCKFCGDIQSMKKKVLFTQTTLLAKRVGVFLCKSCNIGIFDGRELD